jgi:RNA polymerase sigma factor (sigma-70 family)
MLTNEELVQRIKSGKKDLILDLWIQVRRFVVKRAYCFLLYYGGNGRIETEDLIQSGYIALVDAINTYDYNSGQSFINYLNYFLRRQFRREAGIYTSRRDAITKAESLDKPIQEDEDGEITLLGTIASPTAETEFEDMIEQVNNSQIVDMIVKCMQKLSPMERDVLLQIYINQRSRKEIAENNGVSDQKINQIHNTAMRRLRLMPEIRKIEIDNYLDLHTNFYKHKGAKAFNTGRSSVVEDLILKREEQRGNLQLKAFT